MLDCKLALTTSSLGLLTSLLTKAPPALCAYVQGAGIFPLLLAITDPALQPSALAVAMLILEGSDATVLRDCLADLVSRQLLLPLSAGLAGRSAVTPDRAERLRVLRVLSRLLSGDQLGGQVLAARVGYQRAAACGPYFVEPDVLDETDANAATQEISMQRRKVGGFGGLGAGVWGIGEDR